MCKCIQSRRDTQSMKASNLERPDFLNQLKNANERLKAEVANELSDFPDAGDRSNIGDNMIKSQLNRTGISNDKKVSFNVGFK